MTEESNWRPISAEESATTLAVIAGSGIAGAENLAQEVSAALVRNETAWILDIKLATTAEGIQIPNGPLPVRAFVPNEKNYQGEILVWVTDGHVSGLEYSWVTDSPPDKWPDSDEMEILGTLPVE